MDKNEQVVEEVMRAIANHTGNDVYVDYLPDGADLEITDSSDDYYLEEKMQAIIEEYVNDYNVDWNWEFMNPKYNTDLRVEIYY